jgi:hypothetical protein
MLFGSDCLESGTVEAMLSTAGAVLGNRQKGDGGSAVWANDNRKAVWMNDNRKAFK